MFGSLGPYAFFIHAVFNLVAVAIVYCFYPEVACRTLEEIDLLFASKNPFVWETEKKFRELKLQHTGLVRRDLEGKYGLGPIGKAVNVEARVEDAEK